MLIANDSAGSTPASAAKYPAGGQANPYRGALWLFGIQFVFVAFMAVIADTVQGGTKIAVTLLLTLWVIFIILHAQEVQDAFNRAISGKPILGVS